MGVLFGDLGIAAAIKRSMAVIEFDLQGNILHANENFLTATGYGLAEIKGRHHSIFADPAYAASAEYKTFWANLGAGRHDSGQYRRLAKGGREIWLQASYNPVFSRLGKPVKVVKFATDITAQKLRQADSDGQIAAIGKAMAVIEFELDGTIRHANGNFLGATGYALEEIKGKHHRMFVESGFAGSAEYREFWAKLGRGEYQAGEYRRFGKGGREIWIQACYNPIRDMNGRPFKVVKFATDITVQKLRQADVTGQIAAIDKVMAVIEFDLDGTIRNANGNFLGAMGYGLDEIKGRHHRMFVDPAEASGRDYQSFWAKLARGEHDAGQYRRIAKEDREIWIQASYNPIRDMNGKPFKVVKYATDITMQMQAVRTIMDASSTISAASHEISAGSQDLAQRTESQAATVEETAAAMHEITQTVRHNAENASHADQLAAEATVAAGKGGEIMTEVTTAMGALESSADQIGSIVSLIDEIAFQTNLLALNASVEAARAGEAGKGFAVVAQEVRALAQRSANASKDIKALIQKSNGEVRRGSGLVGQAAHALAEIVASIQKVSRIITEIATASSEQATGLDQINTAVASLDEMTQRNAALVEENRAAVHSLSDQADELARVVEMLRGSEAKPKAHRAPPFALAAE